MVIQYSEYHHVGNMFVVADFFKYTNNNKIYL